MALLNDKNKYIKLQADGSFEIYKNKETREKEKRAVSYQVVINKYEEICRDLYSKILELAAKYEITGEDYKDKDHYLALLDKFPEFKALVDKYMQWYEELRLFSYDVHCKQGATNEYPLMKQHYPNIKNSIPEVLEWGSIESIKAENTWRAYEAAKRQKIFNETTDC